MMSYMVEVCHHQGSDKYVWRDLYTILFLLKLKLMPTQVYIKYLHEYVMIKYCRQTVLQAC